MIFAIEVDVLPGLICGQNMPTNVGILLTVREPTPFSYVKSFLSL